MTPHQLTPDEQRRVQRLTTLFDLRMFIGSLFLVFGAILTPVGVSASAAQIAKAAGINISLWTGIVLLLVGAAFVAWTLMAPPELKTPSEPGPEDQSQTAGKAAADTDEADRS